MQIALPSPLIELVAKHLANCEAKLALERKYPDWSEEAEAAFINLEHGMDFDAAAIADKLMELLHKERYDALCDANAADSAKRGAEFDAWHAEHEAAAQ